MRILCRVVWIIPALGVWRLEGLPAVQEEPRGILSKLLGVAQSPAGSMVIYLCVCEYAYSVVGELDLSESRSGHATQGTHRI